MLKETHNLLTAENLLALPDDGLRHELIRGELKNVLLRGSQHDQTAAWICGILATYIAKHGLGCSFGAGAGFILEKDPDTVLAPDFAFVSKTRVPGGHLSKGFFPGAPDLAVEIISPNDRAVEVDDKIQQWLDAGSRQVWIINLNRRTITVHQKDCQPRLLRAMNEIEGGDLLPGFEAKVEDLLPPLGDV